MCNLIIGMNKRETARYPVLCSWCLKQGQRKVVEYTTVEDSHGICPRCYERVMEEIE